MTKQDLQKINDVYFRMIQDQSKLIGVLAKDMPQSELERLWHEVKGIDLRRS